MCGLAGYQKTTNEEISKFISDFRKIKYRGPDNTIIYENNDILFMFHRLAIMDTSNKGNQPFNYQHVHIACNGEIYNFKELDEEFPTFNFMSNSDTEVLIPLYLKYGIKNMMKQIDGEFAFIIWDEKKQKILAGRDPLGIRPLFYGYTKEGNIAFASEMKVLHKICDEIKPFPPGHYYDGKEFIKYIKLDNCIPVYSDRKSIFKHINYYLTEAIRKRLQSDVPLGFLLSGGLDSSLVVSIARKILGPKHPIHTFAVGIKDGPIDTKYARQVADYLGTIHHEYLFTKEDIKNTLKELIFILETYDVTTIRASIGMYLLSKYIRENTDIKVLLTGEVSDELFGYKYTDFAPNPQAFQDEAEKRIKEIYMYDVLRADRCISSNGLEARVPFSDYEFVKYVMQIAPEVKMNSYNVGKYLLRRSFDDGTYLPDNILYRDKAAFSDAVGHSSVDYLKEMAEKMYSDSDFKFRSSRYSFNKPFSKEALMYREIFDGIYTMKREKLIKAYWMPNKEWENCDVNDPSARELPNYGKSGE